MERTVDTLRGRYKIIGDGKTTKAVSVMDDNDYFDFDKPEVTDEEVKERIRALFDFGEVGVWRTDFENIPRGVGMLLYSGELYEPAWGCISEDDDEVISSHTEYDHCPLNHIDQFMIIPDFEP